MAIYTTTSCGSCGAEWESMSVGKRNSVGPPLVKCKVCNTLNKTSHKLYRNMNTFNRILFWLGEGTYSFIFGLGGLGGAIGMALFANDINIFLRIIIPIILGALGCLVLINLFNKPKQISEIEEIYDKNGGFMWSDDFINKV